jgi:tRNA C32,U32 (ribose-2'-O)-methylase TrmJ
MIMFEDRASENGLRLVAKVDETYIQIGLNYVAPDGDFQIEISEPSSDGKTYLAKWKIVRNFKEAIEYVENIYGTTNLRDFTEKASRIQKEMFNDKYVVKWKKRKYPLL